jgi:hypothetical protein
MDRYRWGLWEERLEQSQTDQKSRAGVGLRDGSRIEKILWWVKRILSTLPQLLELLNLPHNFFNSIELTGIKNLRIIGASLSKLSEVDAN